MLNVIYLFKLCLQKIINITFSDPSLILHEKRKNIRFQCFILNFNITASPHKTNEKNDPLFGILCNSNFIVFHI